ncbi:MAG: Cobalamin import system permease protein BtuC [Methanomassiliicoccales archaeon PtaU1.Bin030]|nr:MAG: Cobalamin import system permease protein BtuC [Methanomassiliicoccales archaeon PtaU1.Bin030]
MTSNGVPGTKASPFGLLSAFKGRNDASIKGQYRTYLFNKFLFMLSCGALVVVISGVSATLGSYDLRFLEVYQIIFDHLLKWSEPETVKVFVVWQLRLPRIIMGVVAGFGLAIAGTAMQGIMKNPLADPYTTGISAGAGFGAAIAIILNFGVVVGQYAIIINAFLFSLIPTFIIVSLTRFRRPTPSMMVLAGIATMYIFTAMTSLFMISADPNSVQAVYVWTVGTLDKASWTSIPIVFAIVVLGSVYLQVMAKNLNVMGMGDAGAKSLGVNVERTRVLILAVISLMTAAIVSFTGVIGFIGLVSPHVVRIFLGSDNKYLLPASGLFGAALLLGADAVARTIIAPTILPVGIITAFIGGPLFLYLIMRREKEVW